MEKKYIQREETRYQNNEFANMPSVDYGTWRSDRLCAKNKNRIDFLLAKEICAKYGFGCTYINSTFGGDDADFFVYFKLDIDADMYDELLDKAYKENNRESQKKCWAIWNQYADTYAKMHKCMHELDEQTALMFECGWSGNCGTFGSDDITRQTYLGCNSISSWKDILRGWHPSIHDTKRQLTKGTYIIAHTYYIKPEKQNSPELDETMEQTLLNAVRNELSEEYTAKYEVGKRQSDNESYKALIVRYKDGDYCCMVNFSRDWLGRYTIYTARPLCGESSWIMDWQNPTEDIRCALGRCAK